MNIPKWTAAASMAAPNANNSAPIAKERVRPRLSDRLPAKRAMNVAESKIEETMMPSREDERGPKLDLKVGMEITGPMVEVSSLQ